MKKINIPLSVKAIYFIGVKGVGMSSLAVIAKQAGLEVGGSDVAEEFITDHELISNGIILTVGFSESSIRTFLSDKKIEEVLIVTTAAHGGFDNPQAVYAKKMGYKVVSHGQAVAAFMKGAIFGRHDFCGISVAGSHGKTTISAMISTFLTFLKADPTYTVGTSDIFPIGSAGHFGRGKFFVAEADEYISDLIYDRTPKLLYQKPFFAIINNVDFDHPDCYKNVEDVEETFKQFLSCINTKGGLIINGDDSYAKHLIHNASHLKVLTYGEKKSNNFYLSNFVQHPEYSEFDVYKKNDFYGLVRLSVPGKHNGLNALSAIALLDKLGYSYKSVSEVLPKFLGVKRRIEVVGKTKNGAILIDDYAHHPLEIVTTLKTLRDTYPKRKIVCIFQPHTYSRLEKLFKQFAESLSTADHVVILPTYATSRADITRDKNGVMSRFCAQVGGGIFLNTKDDVVKYVEAHFLGNGYVVLTMGAGDVYKINEKLITNNQ